MRFIVYTVTH